MSQTLRETAVTRMHDNQQELCKEHLYLALAQTPLGFPIPLHLSPIPAPCCWVFLSTCTARLFLPFFPANSPSPPKPQAFPFFPQIHFKECLPFSNLSLPPLGFLKRCSFPPVLPLLSPSSSSPGLAGTLTLLVGLGTDEQCQGENKQKKIQSHSSKAFSTKRTSSLCSVVKCPCDCWLK